MERLTLNKLTLNNLFWEIMSELNREGQITKWLTHFEWDNLDIIFGKEGNFCFVGMLNKPNSWWKTLYYNYLIESSFVLKNCTSNFSLFSIFIRIFMVIPITIPEQVSLKRELHDYLFCWWNPYKMVTWRMFLCKGNLLLYGQSGELFRVCRLVK